MLKFIFLIVSPVLMTPYFPFQKHNSKKEMSTIKNSNSDMVNDSILPPVAKKETQTYKLHGKTWTDDYAWMRLSDEQKEAESPDQQTMEVLDYLNAENMYREKQTASFKPLEDKLFDEIKGRIKQTDMSVPFKYQGYFYITRFEDGKEYPIYSRKKDNLNAPEEILLDVNNLAKGYSYFAIGGRSVSTNNQILAYSEDNVGRRQYTIKFKNLSTGVLYNDQIMNTSGGITWANDNKHVFYSINDETLRSYKIMRHELGTDPKNDVTVYHETDDTYTTYVYKTKSQKFIIIASNSTLSNEYRVLDADKPTGIFSLFNKREKNLEYSIDHFKENWYINTNKDGALNFKIMSCPLYATSKENWVDFIPYDKNTLTTGFEIFIDYMVISERKEGMTRIKVKPWSGSNEHYIAFDEDVYTVYTSINPDFNTPLLRIEYSSLTTPGTTYDYNMLTKKLELKKRMEVVGNFNPSDYTSEKRMAKAEDGTLIPLSVVYKKGFPVNGSMPVLLYGYGSYGASMDPFFSSARLSLLDRGFAFAIAHIRGGQEMGRHWYEDGKYFKKKNTFTDFIACGEYLIKNGFAAKDKLFAQGGSAGGLLIGAVVNMKPEIWRGVIAQVPFVDVINTMLDESIPLTTGEFDEWGNPKQKDYFDYMFSYSPYDNVEKKDYPAMLVTTGYWDSQVQYWEPAKWVAKLRANKTDKNPLYFYCNMDTGHGGASGRFKKWRETAMEYTFLLSLAGVKE